MDEKDIEQLLQEKADNIPRRDFSAVWKEIEGRIEAKPCKKRHHWKWISGIVASVACIGIVCAIVLLQVFKQDTVYLVDDLNRISVQQEEFFSTIGNSNMEPVDLSNYVSSDYALYKTMDGEMKGGTVSLFDKIENSNYFISLKFFDQSVNIDELIVAEYDLQYSVGETAIEYRLKESYPEDELYIYDIKAAYNSVNYLMEYTCFTGNIEPFLTEFFS